MDQKKWDACQDPIVMMRYAQSKASVVLRRWMMVGFLEIDLETLHTIQIGDHRTLQAVMVDVHNFLHARGRDLPPPHAYCYVMRDVLPLIPPRETQSLRQDHFDWKAWDSRRVQTIVHDLARRRAFDEFPILADALEEEGYACAVGLDHLRNAPIHCTGCWMMSALLRNDRF